MMVIRRSGVIDIGSLFRRQIVVIAPSLRGIVVVSGFLSMQHRRRMQIADQQRYDRHQKEEGLRHDRTVNIGS